jgi:hypothetical protein
MQIALVAVWRLLTAVSAGAVVYVFGRLAMPAIFDSFDLAWPVAFIDFMHYFKIDLCISMIIAAITFRINKAVAMAILRAIT